MFATSERTTLQIRNESAVFDELKKEIDQALKKRLKLLRSEQLPPQLRQIDEGLALMGEALAAHVQALSGLFGVEQKAETPPDPEQIRKENIGINHIIDNINILVNGSKTPPSFKPNEIETLTPLHQTYFAKRISTGFAIKTILLGTSWVGGTFGLAGYGGYSFYSDGVESVRGWLSTAGALCVCFLTPRLIMALAISEQVKFIKNLFGDRYEHVKSLCAEHLKLKNEMAAANDHVPQPAYGSVAPR